MKEIINKICGQIPEGWGISLHMENGAAYVEVCSDNGNVIEIDGGGESIEEQLNEALCIANGFID